MLRLRLQLVNSLNNRSNIANSIVNRWNSASSSSSPLEKGNSQSYGLKQSRYIDKLPARPPLLKNFFLGIVDRELLTYPEVISRDDMKQLQSEVEPIRNYLAEKVDAKAIDSGAGWPKDMAQELHALGVYGLNVPLKYGGKGWQWSQSLLATEEEANCTDLALSLVSHRMLIDTLVEIGTAEQQEQLLPQLATGALVATEAIYEYEPTNEQLFNTEAQFIPEDGSWCLNGTKAFVLQPTVPAHGRPLYIVAAQTKGAHISGNSSICTTLFLVDSGSKGVQVSGEHQVTLGCKGIKSQLVSFKNVTVSANCILGRAHEGHVVANTLQRAHRLRSCLIALGLNKRILGEITEHIMSQKQNGVSLIDIELNKVHLSKAMCNVYAAESMLYMTAGLLDEFELPDVDLEVAATKYFAMKQLYELATTSLEIHGSSALIAGDISERFFRQATQLYTEGETLDSLRLVAAITGLQYAGKMNNSNIVKSRNPLLHPGHIFSKFLQQSTFDAPKTDMKLHENLHPSLHLQSTHLEHSIARLQMAAEALLIRYGHTVVDHHHELLRLTEMTSLIYASFASLARASRSYCIGLRLADHEMLAASAITVDVHARVKTLCEEISLGPYINNDNNYLRLSKQIAKSKGYYAEHPLTYNF